MSFAVEKEAWALIKSGTELTDSDKVVLLKASFWANGDRECWHGIQGFVDENVASRSQVINSLKKLKRIGAISKRPQSKKEGRGRANDVIVVHPFEAANGNGSNHSEAAESKFPHPPSSADQSPNSGAAKSKSDPQQSPNSGGRTNKASERNLKDDLKDTASAIGKRRRNLPLPTVGRLKVTEEELALADAALQQFNERNGSRLRLLGRANGATESLKRIVERLRESEGITAEELRAIVDRNFDNPWWTGPARVGNIFGPKAWQGAVVNDGVARSSRTARRSIDTPGRRRSEPDW